MNIAALLTHLGRLELQLAAAYREAARIHVSERDLHYQSLTFARQCDRHAGRLPREAGAEGCATKAPAFSGELLDDLRRLFLLASETSIAWVIAGQAAKALRDDDLLATVRGCHLESELQVKWLITRIKDAAPQALVVAE